MKRVTFKLRVGRIAVLILAIALLSALIISFVGCNGNEEVPDPTPQQDQPHTPDNGETEVPDDVPPSNGIPNPLQGQTVEGRIYHIINEGTGTASPFMMITEEGKHYYVNAPQGSSQDPSDEASPLPNTGSSRNSAGGNSEYSLGDTVRVTVNEGSDGGKITTVTDGTVTLVKEFDGALLNARVYAKDGIALTSDTPIGEHADSAWYHRRFGDYGDYKAFLSQYGLEGYVDSMYNAFSDGSVPTVDEAFFENNSVHLFAVPYVGDGGMTQDVSHTLYKEGNTLCLMIKEPRYTGYISDLVGTLGDMAKNMGEDVKNGIKNAVDGAKDAVDDAADKIKDTVDGNGDTPNTNTAPEGENTPSHEGVYCKFYLVVLGEEGKGLDNGAVLISQ